MPSNNQVMTYEERCQHLVEARAALAAKRGTVPVLDETLLADLQQTPRLTYLQIAYRNKTSIGRVWKLAKSHGLTRYKKGK